VRGIQVLNRTLLSIGQTVSIYGTMGTVNGERVLTAL
jgi:hypothetical protein